MPLSLRESVEIVCELAEQNVFDEHDICDEELMAEIPRQEAAIANVREFFETYFAESPCTNEDDERVTVDLLDGEDHYLVDYAVGKVSSMFDCHAFDVYNAMEQCSEAHPGCSISRVYLITRLK